MFEVVFLGTSASAPSIERGLSAAMVLYRDQRFLVDCGEGTQRQILRSNMGFRKLDKILLTHGHLDHILGLGGIISTFSRWENLDSLNIYGGHWALRRVDDLVKIVLRGDEVDMHVDLRSVRPGRVWSDRTMTISAFPVVHRGPGCFGYVFEEKSRHPFLADKADELGVPRGPERKILVDGHPVTLDNGRVVTPDQVLGAQIQGVKLVHVGDTGRTDNLVEACRGADALVIEATYVAADADLAARFGHLTSEQAASLARDAGVQHLFLVHISRRYPAHQIAREAQAIFPNTTVPRDLDHYRIGKGIIERVKQPNGH